MLAFYLYWSALFVLLWIGMGNMNDCSPSTCPSWDAAFLAAIGAHLMLFVGAAAGVLSGRFGTGRKAAAVTAVCVVAPCYGVALALTVQTGWLGFAGVTVLFLVVCVIAAAMVLDSAGFWPRLAPLVLGAATGMALAWAGLATWSFVGDQYGQFTSPLRPAEAAVLCALFGLMYGAPVGATVGALAATAGEYLRWTFRRRTSQPH